jgi:uncharacterized GH25 family protein
MYKLSIIITFITITLSPFTRAHDFWLEPESFRVKTPSALPIKFQVGHKGHANAWDLHWKRIVSLRQYQTSGILDMSASVTTTSMRDDGSAFAIVKEPGSFIVGFESYHSTSSLGAERFNKYAEKEGLRLVLASRIARGMTNTRGKEIYSRKAKSIIQAGSVLSDNILMPIGQTLEIVPLVHPYRSSDTNDFGVKVIYKGKPLNNAKVRLVSLDNSDISDVIMLSDNHGVATFNLAKKGSWMFASVWSVPLHDDDRADFETYFSSLTLAF